MVSRLFGIGSLRAGLLSTEEAVDLAMLRANFNMKNKTRKRFS